MSRRYAPRADAREGSSRRRAPTPGDCLRSAGTAGFSAIELALVAAVLAALAVLATPGYVQYVRRAKTAEVHGSLAAIAAGSRAYFITTHVDANGTALLPQFPGRIAVDSADSNCCAQAGGMCGRGGPRRWAEATWAALGFAVEGPHRYRYRYQSWDDSTRARYRATATGDLDCDGVLAVWRQNGWADDDAGVRVQFLTIAPNDELE